MMEDFICDVQSSAVLNKSNETSPESLLFKQFKQFHYYPTSNSQKII